MRKWLFLIGLSILLVACQSTAVEEPEQEIDETEEVEKEEQTERKDGEEESKEEETTEITETEEAESKAETSKQETLWKKPTEIEQMEHLEIVHLAYDILTAQVNKDYAFLKNVASKGTKIDEANNRFSFENVTYPFQLDFFTKEELDELEFRFTHEEDGVVYVGFGVINYEEESSFVIEFQFIEESGAWKLQSMDINK